MSYDGAKRRRTAMHGCFRATRKAGHGGPKRGKWLRLLERAGLSDLHPHDLRRSLGSWMASSGASTTVTMRALGHKSVSAALIYQRLAADPVRAEMQKAVTALVNAAAPKAGELVELSTRKRIAKRG